MRGRLVEVRDDACFKQFVALGKAELLKFRCRHDVVGHMPIIGSARSDRAAEFRSHDRHHSKRPAELRPPLLWRISTPGLADRLLEGGDNSLAAALEAQLVHHGGDQIALGTQQRV